MICSRRGASVRSTTWAMPRPRLPPWLANIDREALLSVLGSLLGDDRPTVFVVEDAHWADDATLDVLRWLVRRLVDHRGLVVLTYRSTDVGQGIRCSDCSAPYHHRSRTASSYPHYGPQAVPAVRDAGRDVDVEALARVTGGTHSSSPRCSPTPVPTYPAASLT